MKSAHRSCPPAVALLALALFAPAAVLRAEDEAPPPSVRALRLLPSESIRLDGRLDDGAWREAPAASGFRQREPKEGVPAQDDTEVRVRYDGDTLYVGVLAKHSRPDDIVARILRRDRVLEPDVEGKQRFAGDDAVALLFDPFHDRRNAVVFATNPNGAEFDALITDEGPSFNVDWRGVWSVAAARTNEGWSAEFAIPFRTLRYPSGEGAAAWGFNVARLVRRTNELSLLSGWSREDGGLHRVSRAGLLEGLADLPRAPLNLEIKPFGLSGANRLERDSFDPSAGRVTDGSLDLGLDAKYEVRPGLVLDATVKPDFAQVEADDQQINLTRFDLFFPEKRDFFLENAGIFEFGVRGYFEPPPFLLFFSRRIGIGERGALPVAGGVRLSGRVGRQTIGLLDTYTQEAGGEPRSNFGVLRVKRDVGGSNYVGAILVDRRGGGAANTAGGADFSYWPTGSLNLGGFWARTGTRGAGGDDSAWRLGADYNVDRLGFSGQHLVIGPEARADVGFITRTDIRRSEGTGRFSFRPGLLGLRKVNLLLGVNYIADTHGQRQDRSAGPAAVFEWERGELLRVFVNRGRTRVPSAFPLSGRVDVAAGDYSMRQLSFFGSSNPGRPLVLTAQGDLFDIYGGHVSSVGAAAALAHGAHLTLGLGYTRNNVGLPAGGFGADLVSLRLAWAFTTRLTAHALVQYNGLEKKLFTNLRLNFIHRPGSDLYLVLNEERGTPTSDWAVAQRGVVAKLTYLLRF
jgi:hypothetical protein